MYLLLDVPSVHCTKADMSWRASQYSLMCQLAYLQVHALKAATRMDNPPEGGHTHIMPVCTMLACIRDRLTAVQTPGKPPQFKEEGCS